jgi:hypothetical protein
MGLSRKMGNARGISPLGLELGNGVQQGLGSTDREYRNDRYAATRSKPMQRGCQFSQKVVRRVPTVSIG